MRAADTDGSGMISESELREAIGDSHGTPLKQVPVEIYDEVVQGWQEDRELDTNGFFDFMLLYGQRGGFSKGYVDDLNRDSCASTRTTRARSTSWSSGRCCGTWATARTRTKCTASSSRWMRIATASSTSEKFSASCASSASANAQSCGRSSSKPRATLAKRSADAGAAAATLCPVAMAR